MTDALDRDPRRRVWRRLIDPSGPWTGITRIRVIDCNIFAPQEINLERIALLVGGHGGGKTAFFRLIETAFGVESHDNLFPYRSSIENSERLPVPSIEGTVQIEVRTPSGNVERSINLGATWEERREAWSEVAGAPDPWHTSALHAFNLQSFLNQEYPERGLDSILEKPSRSPIEHVYSASELKVLANILGRQYQTARCLHWPVDIEMDAPFVEATIGDVRMESGRMSFGELWVHYILGFALSVPGDWGPLLIDEPESLLAARGQRPLIDEVARRIVSGKMQLLVATHSPEVYSRFPLKRTLLSIHTPSGLRFVEPKSAAQIRDAIGLSSPLSALVLVEDIFASKVLVEIATALEPGLEQEIEVVPAGGKDKVWSTFSVLKNTRRMPTIGVLDGDQRHAIEATVGIYTLPGEGSPEDELVRAAQQEPQALGRLLGRDESAVLLALDSCRGRDHQYWIDQIARALSLPVEVLIHVLVRAWLENTKIRSQAEGLVAAIAATCDRST